MNPNDRLLARMRELCAEIGAEDGIDPRRLKRKNRSQTANTRKTRQLCGQVDRALSLALAASDDPLLQVLTVARVRPAPDARRLRVELSTTNPTLRADPGLALARVAAAAGWLRSEVAAGVHRRRMPALVYLWADPPGELP